VLSEAQLTQKSLSNQCGDFVLAAALSWGKVAGIVGFIVGYLCLRVVTRQIPINVVDMAINY